MGPCLFLFLTTSTYGSNNPTTASRRMERAKPGFLRMKPACFAVRVNRLSSLLGLFHKDTVPQGALPLLIYQSFASRRMLLLPA